MKMLEKFLKEVVSIIAGSGSEKIVDILYKKKNLNEFLIAKKLNVTINQARNILYKLGDEGLVYFMRKKDTKSGGWYTYFWTLDEYKSMINYKNKIVKEIDLLNNELTSKKTKQFYFCSSCGMELSEENALPYNFICPECGIVFELKNPISLISELEKKIANLQEKLLLVEGEISLLKDRENAVRAKTEKKAAQEKESERVKKKAAKEREKKKLGKKTAKKGKIKKTRKSPHKKAAKKGGKK